MQWISDGLSTAAGLLRDPFVVLLAILTVSFTLLASFLNHRSLAKRFSSDFPAFLTYFASFFLLLFAAPVAYLLLAGRAAGLAPAALGLRIGNWKLGLLSCLLVIPLGAITLANSARDPVIRGQYPFSKDAMATPLRFAVYEAAYILLYYLAWDFAFRGALQFSLAALLAPGLPGTIVAILVQTLLSTVYHLGHPDSEIWGAFAVGLIFGAIAAATGSFLYPFAIHAMVGVGNDIFIYTYAARERGARTREIRT
jgi:hypothetical protein